MWSPAPVPPIPSAINLVVEILDPVLTPLGFAPGQGGASERQGQVIFCSADDGCVDLVVDLEATPDWRITGVRYWGFPSDRWHLDFDEHADLAGQLRQLAESLPIDLA
jgi:hypothetical protein